MASTLGVQMKFLLRLAVIGLGLAGIAEVAAADKCSYDESALLALDENAFDQDLANGGGGWRKIGDLPNCQLAAADLIAAYRTKHPSTKSILLSWHEGQMRAMGGQVDRAVPLLLSSKQDPATDVAGWNYYVDATVAFLGNDREKLIQSSERLSAVVYPLASGAPPLVNGYMEMPTQPGQPPMKFRWPPNIDIVEGLIACFGKPYTDAYIACRPPLL